MRIEAIHSVECRQKGKKKEKSEGTCLVDWSRAICRSINNHFLFHFTSIDIHSWRECCSPCSFYLSHVHTSKVMTFSQETFIVVKKFPRISLFAMDLATHKCIYQIYSIMKVLRKFSMNYPYGNHYSVWDVIPMRDCYFVRFLHLFASVKKQQQSRH